SRKRGTKRSGSRRPRNSRTCAHPNRCSARLPCSLPSGCCSPSSPGRCTRTPTAQRLTFLPALPTSPPFWLTAIAVKGSPRQPREVRDEPLWCNSCAPAPPPTGVVDAVADRDLAHGDVDPPVG